MSELNRIDLIWNLLSDAHPYFCVKFRERHNSPSLLVNLKNPDGTNYQGSEEAEECYATLLKLSDAELGDRARVLFAQKAAEYEAKHPFNQPEAIATDKVIEFWSRAEHWTILEAAILINGRNPDAISESNIEFDQTQTTIATALKNLLNLLERARYAGTISRTNSPKHYIDWLELKQIEMPAKLKEMTLQLSKTPFSVSAENRQLRQKIAALESQLASTPPLVEPIANEKPIHPKEKASLLKLVLGMAIKGYSYDPKSTRSTQISEIASDLRQVGLALDEDTVRGYLNEAKAEFPDSITEQKD